MNKSTLNLLNRKTVLLFYKEYEADKFVKYDRYLKRLLRPLYQSMHRRQKKTGFRVSFELMRHALAQAGCDVHVNDYRTARANPDYPVGVIGFPLILDDWTLPNPAILGPSLYDHPGLAPDLFKDARFKKYAVLAPWTMEMFKPWYGDRCFCWHAGIDLEGWPDLAAQPKRHDFLIYDKVRWDHDPFEQSLIDPIIRILQRKGLSYEMVRYKFYDYPAYRKLLSGARGLLFLCEHETQGIAYQEALASGVPILAWDQGFWADPLWKQFEKTQPRASSVPFFSPACGETFRDIGEFDSVLERFHANRATYDPRSYVKNNLNMATSAGLYMDEYFRLAPSSGKRAAYD